MDWHLNWHLLGVSFVMVFVSELGDKSQLAAIALSGSSKSLKAIFLGTSAALLLASFLGVLLGEGISQLLPMAWVKGIAATGFAIMGLKLLLSQSELSESELCESELSGPAEVCEPEAPAESA